MNFSLCRGSLELLSEIKKINSIVVRLILRTVEGVMVAQKSPFSDIITALDVFEKRCKQRCQERQTLIMVQEKVN